MLAWVLSVIVAIALTAFMMYGITKAVRGRGRTRTAPKPGEMPPEIRKQFEESRRQMEEIRREHGRPPHGFPGPRPFPGTP